MPVGSSSIHKNKRVLIVLSRRPVYALLPGFSSVQETSVIFSFRIDVIALCEHTKKEKRELKPLQSSTRVNSILFLFHQDRYTYIETIRQTSPDDDVLYE